MMRTFCFLLVASGNIASAATGQEASKPAENVKIAILKFEVTVNGSNQAALGRQLTDRFTKSVLELGRFNVVDDLDVARTMERLSQELKTGDPDLVAPKLGQTLGAAQVLISRVVVFGDTAHVTAKLVDVATSKTINVYAANNDGGRDEIVSAMDDVLSQMARDSKLGLTIKEIGSKSATIRVPADVPTIAAAMQKANSGDTILVSAGTYNERVQLEPGVRLLGSSAKDVIVRSRGVVLSVGDCSAGEVRGFTFVQLPPPGAILETTGVRWVAAEHLSGCDSGTEYTTVNATPLSDRSTTLLREARGLLKEGRVAETVIKLEQALRYDEEHPEVCGLVGIVERIAEDEEHNEFEDMGAVVNVYQSEVLIAENEIRLAVPCERDHEESCGRVGVEVTRGAPTLVQLSVSGFEVGIRTDGRTTLLRNQVLNNSRYGLFLDGQTTAQGNVCNHNGVGIYTESSASITLENNECSHNDGSGIEFDDGYMKVQSLCKIIGNKCDDNEEGISVTSGAKFEIRANECARNTGNGISFRSKRENSVIRENTVSSNETGIFCRTEGNIIISGNTCKGNRKRGIETDRGLISGNTCANNGSHGIYIGEKGIVSDNRLEGNAEFGVFFRNRGSQINNTFLKNRDGGCKDFRGSLILGCSN